MKLSDIILENDIDISYLNQLDDLLKQDLEDAAENETNEALLTTAAFLIALPGLLKTIDKVGRTLFAKAGINLSKKEPNNITKAYNVLIQVANKLDSYVDRPFDIMLKPFIKDNIKRKKAVDLLKTLTIAIMAIGGSIDISKSKDIVSAIQQTAGNASSEILQAIGEKNGPKLAKIAKDFYTNFIA